MMRETISRQIHQAREEFVTNLRLRAGTGVILLLFLSWVSLVWSDYNRVLFDRSVARQNEMDAIADIEPIEVWRSRLVKVQAQEAAAGKMLWRAGSIGLAQARIQTTLNDLINKEEFVAQTIKMGVPVPVDGLPDVNRMKARVATSLSPEQLNETLRSIESFPQRLQLDQLNLRRTGIRWNVEMVLTFHVVIAESEQ